MITERGKRGENDGVFFNLPSCSSQLIPQQLPFAYNAIQNIISIYTKQNGKSNIIKTNSTFLKEIVSTCTVYSVHHTLN